MSAENLTIPVNFRIPRKYRHTFELRAGPNRMQIITKPPKAVQMRQSFPEPNPQLSSDALDWMQLTMETIRYESKK